MLQVHDDVRELYSRFAELKGCVNSALRVIANKADGADRETLEAIIYAIDNIGRHDPAQAL